MRITTLLTIFLVIVSSLTGCKNKKAGKTPATDVIQDFMTFAYGGWTVTAAEGEKMMGDFYDEAFAIEQADSSSQVFETLTRLVENLLYDPNSEFRNEDYYGVYASRLASCPVLDEQTRQKYARDARLCALNKTGTRATDFRICDIHGNIRTLYSIETDFILLFFSNPGCRNCLEIIEQFNADDTITDMIDSGSLSVLNIYIDEDLQAWKDYMPVYPSTWYSGFDPDLVLRDDRIYHIRAIPSLYLLDSDKKVLLKDATPGKIINTLIASGV